MSTRTRPRSKLGLLLSLAPIALELLALARRSQKKRSRYTRASKRDRAVDFLLNQAQRRVGKARTRRWF
ncbi:hypothetical protein LAJ19_02070 [Deinococcus taeanensis]|uniref:hypothetical protein n=1 Tax=Deinococcus taeanensis TaxID=2737050 RepID=UPI001CDD5439|nr:hypothetical protein [Deinococcus taeanensis]UBV43033.1 hypothetical protein LAJ19_02070 [Deinococcus taeanensis]